MPKKKGSKNRLSGSLSIASFKGSQNDIDQTKANNKVKNRIKKIRPRFFMV